MMDNSLIPMELHGGEEDALSYERTLTDGTQRRYIPSDESRRRGTVLPCIAGQNRHCERGGGSRTDSTPLL